MNGAGESLFAGAHHNLVRGKQFTIDFDGSKRDNGGGRYSIGQPKFDAIVIILQAVFLVEAPEQCCWYCQDDTSFYTIVVLLELQKQTAPLQFHRK